MGSLSWGRVAVVKLPIEHGFDRGCMVNVVLML
jgi:hypothetical protein